MQDLAPTGAGDHCRGPAGADLELLMYGDFECPFCAAAQTIVARVQRRLGDRLRFVFRHFPIAELHPHALAAAQAAEAAGAQGAFWEMHDSLYAAPDRLEAPDLAGRAGRLGLDVCRFVEELTAGTHHPRVQRDVDSGRAAGVDGTPAFFANGRRVEGAFDAGSLIEALEREPGPPRHDPVRL